MDPAKGFNPLINGGIPSEGASYVNKENNISDKSNIQQTPNFEKSPTVHFAVNWYDDILKRVDYAVESANERVVKLKSESNLWGDNKYYLERVSDAENSLKNVYEEKELLASLGNVFQSEEQIRNLIAVFLKMSRFKNLDDATWKIIWPMIEREARYSDDYYVMYTAHDKDTEIRIIDHHIKGSGDNHVCSKECFTKKVFREIGKLEYNSLEEAFKKHIFTPAFTSDHTAEMTNHFLCANLSLFGNFGNTESTISRFWDHREISKISLPSDNPVLEAKIQTLQDQRHGVLEQALIRKDVATKLGYISAAFGYPLSSDPNIIEKSTISVLDAVQDGAKFDLKAMDSKYMVSPKQLKKSKGDDYSTPMSIEDYLGSTDLQFRLMNIPELFNDNSSVLLFSNTLDDNQVNGKIILSVLNHEIKNKDSLLSLLDSGIVNRIVNFIAQ